MTNAQKRYKAGDIDQVSYVNYMDQAFRIRREYLKAIRAYNKSIIELQYLNAP
jgi:cobalt-zinc-cadmium resistance protein CzcA